MWHEVQGANDCSSTRKDFAGGNGANRMRGITHRAASKETGLSFDDTKRMGIESHTFFAPVPPWAMDDIKVRAVVAYRICITARQPEIPTTLEGLRKVER